MRLVTPVSSPSHINVQASDAVSMTSAVAAVLASIPGGNVVTALVLSGGSSGSRFNLIIEYAPSASNGGGISPANAALGIRFFSGTSHTALDTVGTATSAAAAAANPTFQLVDYEIIGSGAAQVFMGMLLYAPAGSVTPPGNAAYLTQTAWYVNATTGSDGNTGATALTAIRTLAELNRRTQGKTFSADSTIYLSGDFSEEALVLDASCLPGVTVTVRGEYTSSASAAVDTFTAYDGATSTPAELDNGGGVTDYAADVGKFVRVTAGTAVGTSAPLLKAVGLGVLRPGLFQAVDYTTLDPDPADTYVIDTLTTSVGSIQTRMRGAGGDYASYTPRLLLRDLDVVPSSATLQDNYFGPGDAAGAGTLLYRVRFSAGGTSNNYISGTGAHFLCCLNGAGSYLTVADSHLTFWGFASLDAIQCDESFLDIQDSQLIMQGGGLYFYGGSVSSDGGFACMDTGAGYNAAITVARGAHVTTGGASTTWGDGELCGYGIQAMSGSMFIYGVKPTVSGVTNDTLVGAVGALAYAAIPYLDGGGGGPAGSGTGAGIVANV